jgi:hypothetical protein
MPRGGEPRGMAADPMQEINARDPMQEIRISGGEQQLRPQFAANLDHDVRR